MTAVHEPEVFTKAFKIKGNIVSALLQLGAFFGPLGLGGLAAWAADRAGAKGLSVGLMLGGLGLAIVLSIVATLFVVGVFNSGLRRDLAAALARRFGRNPDDGSAYFVGWSPGRGLNTKEGDTDHDVGFLTLTPETLSFMGDSVGFELSRQQVHWIGPAQQGVPLLFDFGLRIAVYWLDPYGQENAFTLERREGRGRLQIRARNHELVEILRQWHQYGTVPGQQPQAAAVGPASAGE